MSQLAVSAFQPYDAASAGSIVAGPLALYAVSVDSIQPTQLNEGLTEVGKKAAGFDLETPSELQADLLTDIEPVVIGPNGQLYLTDGHHTFTALEDSIYGASNPTVYVNVIANYSNLTEAEFFAQMQANNLLLPLNNGVPETVDDATGAPIPTSLTALTSDVYRGLEYSILKNKSSKLFTTTANITGAIGAATPGLDKMTGFYSDFLEAAAYQDANGGLGLSYLSPGDIALATDWNLSASSTTTLPNVTGAVTAAQLPGFILSQNIVISSPISNTTLANGALDGEGTFTGIPQINAGTVANPIMIGTPNVGFIMELGADKGFTVTLGSGDTYTGGTSILAGTLIITDDTSLGGVTPANATVDPNNVKSSVQADNGVIFNSLTEGNGTLEIGTTAGGGTATFSTNRPIAVGGEAATIDVNGYKVTLTGQIASLGTDNIGIGNATGYSDLTIDDDAASNGVLYLSTPSPYFFGNLVIGNTNTPTVNVTSDLAMGNTIANNPDDPVGEVELNGGTLQAGASFSATDRNLFLGGGSTFDVDGFATSWGSLSDAQRTMTITNSQTTAGSVSFSSFDIASSTILALAGGAETATFTNGIVRSGTASLIIEPESSSALGTSAEEVFSGTGAASLVNGIAQAWIVTNNGVTKGAGPYDFVTYGASGYVKATYTSTLSASTGSNVVALAASASPGGNVAAYALNTEGKTLTLGANTLTIGDGTSADAAGLILASGSAINQGTLAFGGSEGEIWLSGTNPTISSEITGSNGLTFSGSGGVSLSTAASVSGVVTINSGKVTLAGANIFSSDSSGLLLQDTKSKPAAAALTVAANNQFAVLDSAGANSTVTITNGSVLTIGDSSNQASTLSSAITDATVTAGAITKDGSGLLDLSGGSVTLAAGSSIAVTGGQLRVATGALKNTAVAASAPNFVLSNSADLQFAQSGGGQYAGAISGAGTLHLIGGTLQLTGTANSYSGGTVVEVGSTLDVTTANLPTINENITDAGGMVVFDQATNGAFTGIISDGQEMGTGPIESGSLDKDDSSGANGGNVTIAAAQTYSGATFVEAGTLTLGVANAIADSSGATLGRVGGGATATLALSADNSLASLSSDASNTTTVQLNGHVLTLDPTASASSNFGGAIVDGASAGSLVIDGAGDAELSGANTFSGGATIDSGTLEIGANGSAGSGAITFGSASAKLQLDASITAGATAFANILTNVAIDDQIDLTGLQYVSGATTATVSGSTLTVTNGTATEAFTLNNSATPNFTPTADSAGGVLLTADPLAPTLALADDTGVSSTDAITSDPAIVYTPSANGDTLLYKADAATTYSTTAPTFATDGSADGQHTVSVEEKDAAGNISPGASLTFTLDTAAPVAPTLALADDTGLSSTDDVTSDPAIVYTPSAAGDTLLYKADSATSYSTTLPTFATDGSADGRHTVSVEEEDAAGNISAPASLTFTLDTIAPSAPTLALADDTGVSSTDAITNDPAIVYTPSAAGDTLLYKADSATSYSTTAPTFATDGSADGPHTVSVEEEDAAGNISAPASLTFTLDTIAPAAPTLALADDTGASNTDAITSDPAIVYTPSANGDTLLYKADAATTYSPTAPTFATDGSADGQHTVSVEEEDAAGNISPAASLTFSLYTQPPVTAPDVNAAAAGGAAATGNVLSNDTVASGDTLSVSGFTDGGSGGVGTLFHGTYGDLTLDANGAYTYSAGATANERTALAAAPTGGNPTEVIAYTDTDAAGNSAMGALTITLDRAPLVAAANNASYTEGAAPALVDGSLSATDPDGLDLVSASVTIGNALAGDALTINGALSGALVNGGQTINYSFAGNTLALTGADTAADYQAALRLVSFATTSEDPTSGGSDPSRTISWAIADGALAATAATTTLTVNAVDNAPVVSAPPSYSGAANTPISLAGVSFADVDDDSGAEQATFSAPAGAFTAVAGGGVAVAGSGSDALVLTGDIADLNAFIAAGSLTYAEPTEETVDILVDDEGNTGAGGPLTAQATTLISTVTEVGAGQVNNVPAGGSITDVVISSGGAQVVDGDVTDATISGSQFVESGGGASGAIVDGGAQVVYGAANGTTLNSGGYQYVEAGGTASGTTVSNGGVESVTGVANGATVMSGGGAYVQPGGMTSGTNVSGGDEFVEIGGTASGTTVNGGAEVVYGTTDGATLNSGGYQYLESGGTASGTTVNSTGVESVNGSAVGTTVNSGGADYVNSGGTTSATTLSGGTEFVEVNATATGTIVDGGAQVVYGQANGTTLNSGGYQYVEAGGVASGTIVNGTGVEIVLGAAIATTDNAGGADYVYGGGVANGTKVMGGDEYVETGGATTGTTVSNGAQVVYGTATSTSLDAGGAQYVSSGGTAIGTTINGGYDYVASGGVVSAATISAGTLELTSGAIDGGAAVTFATSGAGTLRLDDSVHFDGLIAGFGQNQQIDLSDIAFGANTLVSFTEAAGNKGGALTVTDGVNTANLSLLGQYVTAQFTSAGDGHGGTMIGDPPLPATTEPSPTNLAASHLA